jgi:hypothetical protein
LLAIGYSECGECYVSGEPDDPDSAEVLRDWLAEEFDLTPPATAEPLLAEARRLHPDIGKWIKEWQQTRG